MVHAVYGSKRLPYLAGVFSTFERLEAFMQEVPAEVRERLRVVEDPDVELPCFLVEDAGMRVVDRSGLSEALDSWQRQRRAGTDDPERVFGNVYWLRSSWRPPQPGTDYMGILPHVHVDAQLLDTVVRDGLRSLLSSLLRPDELETIDAPP